METKLKKVVAAMATLGMTSLFPIVSLASSSDHELPAENDLFWQVTSSMDRPDDTTACQNAIDQIPTAQLLAYANEHNSGSQGQGNESQQSLEVKQGFYQMCSMLAQMPTEMQADMTQNGVTTNLFGMSDWHSVSGLYFEKAGKGRISFTNTLDFLSYRFMRFMNNFDSMVEMDDGYISLNAAMLDDIKNYGAQLTMYGLDFSEQPDIYVNGTLAGSGDIADVSYDANTGALTFTAKHFSAYKAVAKGSKVKKMTITKLAKKSVKYNAKKSSFRVKVIGKSLKPLSGGTIQCSLGFEQATKVAYSRSGKTVYCVFPMSYFSGKGTYPITISATGKGEVTKNNAFTVK